MGDLGNVKPNITLNQLLMLSPECKRVLSSALVARKEVEQQSVATMTTQAVDMSAPTVEVEISDYFILEVLTDGGSGVNIMTYDIMQKLGLTHLEPIPFVIRLMDQRCIKPTGILRGSETMMSRLTFTIDYVVLHTLAAANAYPLLLGRSWLFQAKVVHNWCKGP